MNTELPVYRAKPALKKKTVKPKTAPPPKKPAFDEDEFIAGQRDAAYDLGVNYDPGDWGGKYKKHFGAVWLAKQDQLNIGKVAFVDEMYDGFREGVLSVRPKVKKQPTAAPKLVVPRQVESPQEREERLDRLADDEVDQILNYAQSIIGKYPVFTKKESLTRVGCVKYGPSFEVSRDVKARVYRKLGALEGQAWAGGYIHIVEKSEHRRYNLTIHTVHRAPNPRTRANLHIE